MKRLAFLFITFFAGYSISFSQWIPIQPDVKVIDNKVKIIFNTGTPTGKTTLVYSEQKESESHPFPDYFERARDKNIDSIHTISLDNIRTGTVYNYRISCSSISSLEESRSINYKFKIISKDGILAPGLVITEGPIISNITENTAVISWTTNLPAISGLELLNKKNEPAKKFSAKNISEKKFHVYLDNLLPDHEYTYRVKSTSGSDSEQSSSFTFRTAPAKFKNFSFAVMSDSRGGFELDGDSRLNGVNYLVLNKFSQKLIKNKPSLILFAGDLIGGITASRDQVELQYQTWKQSVSDIQKSIPIYPCMGNHDALGYQDLRDGILYDPPSPNSNEDIFVSELVMPANAPENEPGYPTYKGNVYSFNYAGVHFISLNSDYYYCYIKNKKIIDDPYAVRIDHRQRKWLKEDLEKNKDKRVVVYFHSPAYPAGGHVGSSLDRIPEVRDSVLMILNDYNVKMIFSGHEHNYSRTRIDKSINKNFKHTIYQFVVGRTGAPSYAQDMKNPFVNNVEKYSRKNHYAVTTVEKDQMIVKIYDEEDNIIDEIKIK
jgi:3',5'-cyclic-AMP phosphodiesterase